MLLVLPVSLADYKSLPTVEKAFEMFPPGSGHKLLVIGSPNVSKQVKDASQSLCQHFAGNGSTFIFDLDCNLGWPTACNTYFQQAAFYLAGGSDDSWLWFEIDSTPTRAGWLDEIENAVHFMKANAQSEGRNPPRYFGASEPARLEFQGTLQPNAGMQMAAVGVYPINMEDVLSLRAISATNIVWYTFLRWYVMPFFAELPLIQNNWQTARYRRAEGGGLECDSVAKWAWDVHFNHPIRSGAVLVHGCKDGTLLDCLMEGPVLEAVSEPTRAEKVGKALLAHRKLIEMQAARKRVSSSKPSMRRATLQRADSLTPPRPTRSGGT
jgi:hypothetical protein